MVNDLRRDTLEIRGELTQESISRRRLTTRELDAYREDEIGGAEIGAHPYQRTIAHNPLLTAEERVNHALEHILSRHTFTAEQKEWLAYIREHLIVNLAIEKENFDIMPVLERHGGLAKARRIFGDKLDGLIEEINFNIAA